MLTLGFLTVCAMDKQRAWWVVDSGEDMSAGFMDIWVFTDAAGTDSRGEALGAEEKDGFAAGVDWGMIQLSLLILFALWLLSALALLCSTRLSWLPTMSICSGIFLLGLMSDYLLGRTAEGGGMIHAGEYVIWNPPGNQAGTHTVFRLKPRGVRRLADMEFMVKMNVNGPATPEDKQLVDGVLTLDVRTEDGQIKIGYEEIKTKLDTLLKLRWNEPLERKMIQIGRQLLPGEFPGNSMELKLAGEIREKINSQSAELEQDETKKELLIEFRILNDQVTTKVVPGHLALWIMPEQGTLTKLDASVDEEVTVSRGATWAKILYVLVPNWQLFWLSDSVGVEAEELSSRRALETAKVEAGKTGDRVDTTKSVKIRKRADVSYREGRVPWKYIFTAFVYVAVYIGVMLSGALMLFENRELA